MRNAGLVIGIDGGGTTTRVMLADLRGRVVAYAEGGAAYLDKDPNARENVREAISRALGEAGAGPGDVVGLTAGIAGYDSPEDLAWVQALTQVQGLGCTPVHVNDAVVAHRGAFGAGAGIIVVAGTGSIILAITESGRRVRNFEFGHYASTAARHIGSALVHEILSGRVPEEDGALTQRVLEHFGVRMLTFCAKPGRRGSGASGIGAISFSRGWRRG